jgi:hypothetical protein
MVRVPFVVGSKRRGAYPPLRPFCSFQRAAQFIQSRLWLFMTSAMTKNSPRRAHTESEIANSLGLEHVWSLSRSQMHVYALHRRPRSTFRSISGLRTRSVMGL